ncbi:MAG TPA: class I SAM-dependent methyltransferase [Planctomycetota bacterium]|nr:class I SAM-dependent methyltransferase [Planctomycetota bacterium]
MARALMDDGYYERERREVLAFVPPGVRRALDVGAATGAFGRALKEHSGCEVWGIEAHAPAAEQAARALDRVLAARVEAALGELPAQGFDLIVFNDSLEHLVEPEAVLAAMLPKLAPGGAFLCSIPNVRYYKNLRGLLLRADWEYVDSGVLDRTHLRFFTHKSIRRMFETLGCEVVRLEGIHGRDRLGLKLLSALTLGGAWDLRFKQLACLARPRDGAGG